MTDIIEQRAERLREAVSARFEQWKADPEAFAVNNPDIVIAIEAPGRAWAGAMCLRIM